MKNVRRLLLILLVLALTLTLFACVSKECEHADEDGDGKCDKCEETMASEVKKVMLFDNGMPTFQFVLEDGVDNKVKKLIDEYVENMEDIDVEIDVVEDESDSIQECEILIGDIYSRGDKYKYDKYSLGKDGYVFKIVDSKIIVNAGSYSMLESAVEEFIEDVLMYDEDTLDMGTLYMEPSQMIEEKQEYNITAVKINGVDIRGYTIARGTTLPQRTAAEHLQDILYDRTGYWLEIVQTADADKSIIFQSIDKVYGENSFNVYTNDKNQLIIDCAFDNKLEDAVSTFLTQKITLAPDGEINFTESVYKQDISFLTYEEFGAKGNGKTDDFEAIYKTHVEANQYGQTVVANEKSTYYIHDTHILVNGTRSVKTIPIKTNVNWGKAKFIIDDTDISICPGDATRDMFGTHIFTVLSDYESYKITDKAVLDKVLKSGLRPGVTKLDISFDYPVMIIPTNSSHTVYRRIGYGAATGSSMHEVIVLDKDGNVDPATPIMFDYTKLDNIEVFRLDIEPITIDGGIFTTKASRVNTIYHFYETKEDEAAKQNQKTDVYGSYIARGINCKRSFTTIKNMEHYVTGDVNFDEQIENGNIVHVTACYTAFYASSSANEVTYENCILTGRRCYQRPADSISGGTGGTYDLNGTAVNKLVFKNCHQSNFWVTVDDDTNVHPATRDTAGALPSMSNYTHDGVTVKMHWGIGGTNFCKNMEYIDSTLSRFDAHSGLYNGKIINSTVNYMALTGNGDFIVENTEWYSEGVGGNSASIFHLRSDYGSTWEGDIKVKNLKAYVWTNRESYLFLHTYNNWYFGYISHMPNLSLDNLDIYDIKTFQPVPAGHEVLMLQDTVKNYPKMHLEYSTVAGKYTYIDLDGDKLVDGTNIPYVYADRANYSHGVNLPSSDPNYLKNLNPVAPPDYIKIINNDGVDINGDGVGDGGYVFRIPKTYSEGSGIPDINGRPDEGFLGSTKFYWGPGENDYYHGTNYTDTQTFIFY